MGVFNWLTQNWFVLLQSAGIIGSLLFTGIAIYSDTKSRRVSNLVALTRQHRDIWTDFSKRPELARVLDAKAKIGATPVSSDEEIFVTVLVLHLNIEAALRGQPPQFLKLRFDRKGLPILALAGFPAVDAGCPGNFKLAQFPRTGMLLFVRLSVAPLERLGPKACQTK